ncbi:MAG: hypothetical protein AB1925_13175 [Actinomycetota bacterium]
MTPTRRRRYGARGLVVLIAALFVAMAGLTVQPANTASAAPCDGAQCVMHLTQGVSQGATCPAFRLYVFGLDAQGNTFVCYATYRNPRTSTWVPVPPLVGVRDNGALCAGPGSAQSPDGLPMVCRDSIWQRYTPALPVT